MTTSNLKTLALSAVTLLIVLLMILWMSGAFQNKIEPEVLPERSAYQGPTLTVERVTLPAFEKATGTLEAKQGGDISAQIQARIKAIHVKARDTVKPGDLLITLDDETIAAGMHMRRRQTVDLSIVHIDVKVGQIRPGRT